VIVSNSGPVPPLGLANGLLAIANNRLQFEVGETSTRTLEFDGSVNGYLVLLWTSRSIQSFGFAVARPGEPKTWVASGPSPDDPYVVFDEAECRKVCNLLHPTTDVICRIVLGLMTTFSAVTTLEAVLELVDPERVCGDLSASIATSMLRATPGDWYTNSAGYRFLRRGALGCPYSLRIEPVDPLDVYVRYRFPQELFQEFVDQL
jgi:hypothetical protein